MSRTERLGTAISLIMVGLALSVIILLPSRELGLSVLGTRWTFRLSGMIQFALVMAGLACAGVDGIIREHPMVRGASLLYGVAFWGLPAIVVVEALFVLRQVSWWGYRGILILFCGGLLALVVRSQYEVIDPSSRWYRHARVFLNALTYASSLYLFFVAVWAGLDAILLAIGVAVASVMLSLGLFWHSPEEIRRTWLYAVLVGLIMGEAAWAIGQNAPLDGHGAGLMLVIYYVLAGLVQQHLWGRLTARVALEYGVLGVAGVTVVLVALGGA